jgi:hypothetical protein
MAVIHVSISRANGFKCDLTGYCDPYLAIGSISSSDSFHDLCGRSCCYKNYNSKDEYFTAKGCGNPDPWDFVYSVTPSKTKLFNICEVSNALLVPFILKDKDGNTFSFIAGNEDDKLAHGYITFRGDDPNPTGLHNLGIKTITITRTGDWSLDLENLRDGYIFKPNLASISITMRYAFLEN